MFVLTQHERNNFKGSLEDLIFSLLGKSFEEYFLKPKRVDLKAKDLKVKILRYVFEGFEIF